MLEGVRSRGAAQKWRQALTSKRALLAMFRVLMLVPAIIEVTFGTDEFTSMPGVVPVLAAVLYTGLKIAQPVRWHELRVPNILLMTLDVAVCLFLIIIPGKIHMPFSLYTLTPVLTSALLLSGKITMVLAAITGAYFTAVYFTFPVPETVEHVSTILSTYLVALSLTAALPYAVNSVSRQRLQSNSATLERRRVGSEIHDGLCQDIYGLRWKVQTLRNSGVTGEVAGELAQLEELLSRAEMDVRGAVERLRTAKSERPFIEQVEQYLKRLERDKAIRCHFEAEDGEPSLDDMVKLEVLCICEEALSNAAKHSEAANVMVRIQHRDGRLKAVVTDDGRGFVVSGPNEGHGLAIMNERAASLAGNLRITSSPGNGTRIELEVPTRCPT